MLRKKDLYKDEKHETVQCFAKGMKTIILQKMNRYLKQKKSMFLHSPKNSLAGSCISATPNQSSQRYLQIYNFITSEDAPLRSHCRSHFDILWYPKGTCMEIFLKYLFAAQQYSFFL